MARRWRRGPGRCSSATDGAAVGVHAASAALAPAMVRAGEEPPPRDGVPRIPPGLDGRWVWSMTSSSIDMATYFTAPSRDLE